MNNYKNIFVYKKGHRTVAPRKYFMKEVQCLGRDCFTPDIVFLDRFDPKIHPVIYKDSLKTNYQAAKCRTWHEKGCPTEDTYNNDLLVKRTREGWSYSIW